MTLIIQNNDIRQFLLSITGIFSVCYFSNNDSSRFIINKTISKSVYDHKKVISILFMGNCINFINFRLSWWMWKKSNG